MNKASHALAFLLENAMGDTTIGRGVIELVGDARKLSATIAEAKISIRTLGEGQKDISAAASQSIDRYVAKLQLQNETLGKSSRETELYKLALRGASDEQINAADSALRFKEAHAAAMSGFMIAGTAIAAAAVGFGFFIEKGIAAEASLHHLNLQTGLSVEILSALRPVAKEAGTDLDTAASMVNKLEKNMLTFAQSGGGKAADAFKQLGYSQKDVQVGLQNMDTFLPEFAKRLIETGVGGEQAGLAMQLMARGGAQALPFLSALSEQTKLLGTETKDQVAQAHEFEKSMAALSSQATNFSIAIANSLLPSLNDILKAFIAGKNEAGLYEGAIRALSMAMSGSDLHMANKQMVDATDELLQLQNELSKVDKTKMSASNFIEYTGALKREIADTETRLKNLTLRRAELEAYDKKPPVTPNKPLADLPPKTGSGGQVEDPYQNLIKGLEQKLLIEKESTEVEKLMFELDHMRGDQYAKLTIAELANLEVAANAIDLKNRDNVATKAMLEYSGWILKIKKEISVADAKDEDQKTRAIISSHFSEITATDYLNILRETNAVKLAEMSIGDLAASQLAGRLQIEKKYNEEVKALDKQRSTAEFAGHFGPDAQAKYDDELARIKRFQSQALSEYDIYFSERRKKESDWTVGASKAMQNYYDESQNFAKQAETAVTNSLKGMEDALVNFSKTGKLDFKSLADSIITDLIRIQIKASITGPLAAAMGSSGWLGGMFGGGSGGSGGIGAGDTGTALLGYASGTDYVPATGPYILHQGEAVIPASQKSGGQTINMGDINIHADNANAATVQQLQTVGVQAAQTAYAMVLKDFRTNGPLRRT